MEISFIRKVPKNLRKKETEDYRNEFENRIKWNEL
jgi:hypothetical protein